MKRVFDFKDYKAYLREVENHGPLRAFRSRLAEAAACQNAYISQVLNGSQHLSLEQADGIAGLLQLAPDEKAHFLLLIQHARAATPSLRKFFAEQIGQSVEKRLALRHRVNTGEHLPEEDQVTYYGEWYYSAIHVLVTLADHRTVEAIATRLNLPPAIARKAVDFLLSCGLLAEKKGELTTGRSRLYLDGASPLITRHHANWRLHALQSLPRAGAEDLHYSSVVTISRADAEAIRESLIQAIQDAKKTIRDSKEEDLFAFHVDFYRA